MGIREARRDVEAWMIWAREHLEKQFGRPPTENELTEFFTEEVIKTAFKEQKEKEHGNGHA